MTFEVPFLSAWRMSLESAIAEVAEGVPWYLLPTSDVVLLRIQKKVLIKEVLHEYQKGPFGREEKNQEYNRKLVMIHKLFDIRLI